MNWTLVLEILWCWTGFVPPHDMSYMWDGTLDPVVDKEQTE